MLSDRSFKRDEIFILSHSSDFIFHYPQSFMYNVSRDSDNSIVNIQNAIVNIATQKAGDKNIYIYLTGHGNYSASEGFKLQIKGNVADNYRYLYGSDLINWISQLLDSVTGKVYIFVESCKSGGFAEQVRITSQLTTSKKNRIAIITSQKKEKDENISDIVNTFSYKISDYISKNYSIKQAINYTNSDLKNYTDGNQSCDTYINFNYENEFIGIQMVLRSYPVIIYENNISFTFEQPNTARSIIQVSYGNSNNINMYALISSDSISAIQNDDFLYTPSDSVVLEKISNNEFKFEYKKLFRNGKYKVVFFGIDADGYRTQVVVKEFNYNNASPSPRFKITYSFNPIFTYSILVNIMKKNGFTVSEKPDLKIYQSGTTQRDVTLNELQPSLWIGRHNFNKDYFGQCFIKINDNEIFDTFTIDKITSGFNIRRTPSNKFNIEFSENTVKYEQPIYIFENRNSGQAVSRVISQAGIDEEAGYCRIEPAGLELLKSIRIKLNEDKEKLNKYSYRAYNRSDENSDWKELQVNKSCETIEFISDKLGEFEVRKSLKVSAYYNGQIIRAYAYPNPSIYENVKIHVETEQVTEIYGDIYDAGGEKVFSFQGSSVLNGSDYVFEYSLNRKDFPFLSGIYFCKVHTMNSSKIIKIVIK